LLVARNLEPIYDNATALRAFALVRAVHPLASLVIAGSGPQRAELEALARELGVADGVTFTGRVDNHAMAQLYRNADMMLNCSLVDNMPNSVLESLACGVPVVSTNVGGVPYLVEDGRTALLVPAAAPAQMAQAVLRLCAEPALAASLREAGLRQVQQYTWHNVRPRLLDVYRSVMSPT
jgi:glycosyltransferase involved in cell wall biosynthesis